jgi:hypothetical protein
MVSTISRPIILSLLLLLICAHAHADEGSAPLSSLIARHALKRHIVKRPRGILRHEYIVPDGPYFQLFDWDMYFMSAALSYDRVSRPIVGSILGGRVKTGHLSTGKTGHLLTGDRDQ